MIRVFCSKKSFLTRRQQESPPPRRKVQLHNGKIRRIFFNYGVGFAAIAAKGCFEFIATEKTAGQTKFVRIGNRKKDLFGHNNHRLYEKIQSLGLNGHNQTDHP